MQKIKTNDETIFVYEKSIRVGGTVLFGKIEEQGEQIKEIINEAYVNGYNACIANMKNDLQDMLKEIR